MASLCLHVHSPACEASGNLTGTRLARPAITTPKKGLCLPPNLACSLNRRYALCYKVIACTVLQGCPFDPSFRFSAIASAQLWAHACSSTSPAWYRSCHGNSAAGQEHSRLEMARNTRRGRGSSTQRAALSRSLKFVLCRSFYLRL